MWKFTQRAFTGGRLDAELMGRQDLAQYYKGASELKNLVVRRQGHLSKRRGTDFVCDLDGLLGYTIDGEAGESVRNYIRECRLIPLVHERDKGYYILMTAGRAFLCSRDGVLLMDGTWARKVDDYELAEYAGEGEVEGEGDKRPFYAAVPYSDDEIAELDFCQSGDTVFLAHKNHPPAKILFTGTIITYGVIQFNKALWAKPVIVSATKSGFTSSSSTRSVKYICTYVKDGIESEPSTPFTVSYNLPWPNTASITINCDKGDNEEDPDYYNIYKSDGTEYGLISTYGPLSVIKLTPSFAAAGGSISTVGGGQVSFTAAEKNPFSDITKISVSPYKKVSQSPDSSQVHNSDGNTKVVRDSYSYNEVVAQYKTYDPVNEKYLTGSKTYKYTPYYYVCPSAISSSAGILMNFSTASRNRLSKLTMSLDSKYFTGTKNVTAEASVSFGRAEVEFDVKESATAYIYVSGKFLKATLNCVGSDGAKKSFVAYDSPDLPSGLSVGTNSKSYSNMNSAMDWLNGYGARRAVFDFGDLLEGAYASDPNFYVESIKVEAFTDAEMVNVAPLYFNGIRFHSVFSTAKTYVDDYVTPNLSISPYVSDAHFAKSGDYPACVGIYKQRLAFASTKNDPFMFWLSCVGDLYNFNTHASIREDDAISATLAATEFPQINHIIVNRDLMLLADSGEWRVAPVSGNTLSYKTVSADMQSAIGCAKGLKPIPVGDEIVFVKRTGETLLATRYNFTSDGYESMDLSVLSQWIFRNNAIVQMAYRQHPDSTIECVLADGTLASLVYMKEHEVCAWSRHELGGGWKATGIATSKAMSRGSTEVMLAVERGGRRELWAMRDDVPVRTSSPAAADHLCMDGMRETEGEGEGMVVVEVGGKRYAGYLYKAEFATVRPEPQGGETIQFEVKNAKDAEVRVLDSGDFRVRAYGVPEDMATEIETGAKTLEDGSIALATGDFRQTLAGCNNGDGRVVVESETPLPLNILSISVNYEIQPLSGSAG